VILDRPGRSDRLIARDGRVQPAGVLGDRVLLASTHRFRVRVPEQIPLLGNTFLNQVWVLDANANSLGISTSNAGRGVLGR
jgi:hypothetical protein